MPGATFEGVPTVNRLDVLAAPRPKWRGVLHSWAFWTTIPAGVLLIVFAEHASGKTASAVYVGALLAVFGTSAAYHRLANTYRARVVMQRLDHSMIYLLIAGSYVPICVVGLPRRWGIPLLCVVGGLAVVGVVVKLLAFDRLAWLSYSLYLVMGWCAVAAFPAILSNLSPLEVGLVVAGGLAYTSGVPVLLLRRPDPRPDVFGYHEVWHGFTVLAAALHFGGVASLVVA